MKSLLIFLFVVVVVSHQQYHPPIILFQIPPWISPIIEQPVFRNHLNYRYYADTLFNPIRRPVSLSTKEVETRAESNRFVQIEPRIKNYKKPANVILSESDHQRQRIQQDPRFLINILSRKSQLLFSTATATFTITSTCTSLRISTCVPRANFRPVAPAVVPNCRRKRQLQSDGDQQFSIVPTKVHPVTTTERPIPSETAVEDNQREFETLIASSKEEDVVQTAEEQEEQKQRNGRLLYYFLSRSNSVASTTITTWSVVSTTLTQTFVPAANFLCVPPGTVICPAAAAGK